MTPPIFRFPATGKAALAAKAGRDVVYATVAWTLIAYTALGFLSEPLPFPLSPAPGRWGPLLGAAAALIGIALLVLLYQWDRFACLMAGAVIGLPLAWVLAMGQHLPLVASRTYRDLRDDALFQEATTRVMQSTTRQESADDTIDDDEARCHKLRLFATSYAESRAQDAIGLLLRRQALVRVWSQGCMDSNVLTSQLKALVRNGETLAVPLGWLAPFRWQRDRIVAQLPLTPYEWCLNNPRWAALGPTADKQAFCIEQSETGIRSTAPPNGPQGLPIPQHNLK